MPDFTQVFKSINFSVSNWKAFAIIALIFLLVLSVAQVRRHYVNWSFKGAVFGIFFGFLLALFLEGFLIIGGKTALIEILGWKSPPKILQVAIDSGRAKLTSVLGIKDQNSSQEQLVNLFQNLNPTDAKRVKSLICEP